MPFLLPNYSGTSRKSTVLLRHLFIEVLSHEKLFPFPCLSERSPEGRYHEKLTIFFFLTRVYGRKQFHSFFIGVHCHNKFLFPFPFSHKCIAMISCDIPFLSYRTALTLQVVLFTFLLTGVHLHNKLSYSLSYSQECIAMRSCAIPLEPPPVFSESKTRSRASLNRMESSASQVLFASRMHHECPCYYWVIQLN